MTNFRIVIILLFIFTSLFASAQRTDSTGVRQIRLYSYVGIAVGHESMVSLFLPKLGMMA
jgi:hypothetical protein